METFQGYVRPDGQVGIRNDVLVIPGGFLATQICSMVAGTRTFLSGDQPSGHTGRDRATIARILIGLGMNPNIAGVLVLGARRTGGYPELEPGRLVDEIARSGKRVELVEIAAEGGTFRALESGAQLAREMVYDATRLRREPCPLSALSLGVKCGGSDTLSGLVGNPAIGHVFDRVVAAGGTAMFGETTEIIGAEHLLIKRAVNAEVAQAILRAAAEVEQRAIASGEDIRTINPVPANIAGGISTLEEKSLGAIHKSGTAPIQGVLAYGERPRGKGLYFCDNWQSANSIFAGYAASGAQLCLYQLGGGGMEGADLLHTSTSAVTPLLWATANPHTLAMAPTAIDFFSGTVLEGDESIEEAGERLLRMILEVASGGYTRVETLRHVDPTQVYLLDTPF